MPRLYSIAPTLPTGWSSNNAYRVWNCVCYTKYKLWVQLSINFWIIVLAKTKHRMAINASWLGIFYMRFCKPSQICIFVYIISSRGQLGDEQRNIIRPNRVSWQAGMLCHIVPIRTIFPSRFKVWGQRTDLFDENEDGPTEEIMTKMRFANFDDRRPNIKSSLYCKHDNFSSFLSLCFHRYVLTNLVHQRLG